MTTTDSTLSTADLVILRDLARRVREASATPENQERIRLWYKHDAHAASRPLLLTETDGGMNMVLPDFKPKCENQWAQRQEAWMQFLLMHHEIIRDDYPIEPWANVAWHIHISDYGVKCATTSAETDSGEKGAYHIEKAIDDIERDFDLLHPRTYSVDREAGLAEKALCEEVYDGILGVRMRGNPWWTMGLTQTAISLVGLEELMVYMFDQPEALHRLMGFLRDDSMALLDWMEREGLLNVNNEDDYIGSGSRGYTKRLPRPEQSCGSPVCTQDIWALIESQETVGVGPNQYEEFVFPYENAFAERFGSIYYGCCEPLHSRWRVLKRMANLKRVSVSPWCDQTYMAENLGNEIVFSRKPNPTLVSTGTFDEEAIREDLRSTLSVTKPNNCVVEIVMKDVHTLHGEPDRLTRWVNLAREEIDKFY